ncbi:5'-nucleotidase C-terminal domain-containing protein [Planococcus shenhongbingii]|uniref:5'-nucleotidase C-terminal domain-containing protein n=1 Tax=Planococcus shenhongbingii TaxID=3058398 RepID=UPI0026392A2E|nr:5'-nucleotidase C-terminal domain-containing protein [Planococcus sp. N016]WKA57837.1 5'-nucleotidase C-terminal domain-containing protein [Planococcus sp. N016]
MKGKVLKTTIAAALTASVIGVQAPADVKAAEGDFELTIMHTNDTHANLDKVANRATLVKQIRAEKPNNLLLDAGDVFSGTLYFNAFEGEPDMKFMNMMGYDAMTFGNHEFDLGSSEEGHKALDEFVGDAEFPFVAANVDFSKNEYFQDYAHKEVTADYIDGNIYNGVVKEVDGEEVGIFGLTTAETATISSPGDIGFTDYLAAAEEAVAAFEAAGVNKIVALTHIGYDDSAAIDNDLTLAKEVEGIDVIVGGHTHTKLESPVLVEGTGEPVVIVQANEYNKFLGQLDVTINDAGIITGHTGKLHDVNAAAIMPDSDVEAALKPYAAEIEALKNQSTGKEAKVALNGGRSATNGDGTGVRASETNLGNLITDGMLAKAKTIDPATAIALQNGGGIRASINAGDITVGEVLTVMPFGNALALMDLTGAEIKAALEHSVSAYPSESGAFLHVAGLQFKFDPTKAAGSRVHSVNVKEGDALTPLDDAKRYKVATNTFTAKGGDNYTMFAAAYKDGRVSEPGFVDYQMFIDYIKTLPEVNPAVEGRITVGAAAEQPGEAKLPFKDLDEKRWSYPFIQDLFAKGIIDGTSDTTFSPKQDLPRWQAVTLMVRALDLPVATAPKSSFTDISALPAERQAEINAAYAEGLIKGSSKTKFNPKEKISREHFALIMNRLYEHANKEEYKTAKPAPFEDISKLGPESQKAIAMLYDLKISEGWQNNYMPTKFTSREETAKMFSLLLPHTEK